MNERARLLAVIPARGGSKGIPRKNARVIAGHPLLAYSIASARASRSITTLVVSTEDAELADIAGRYGSTVVQRPPELSGDAVPTAPVVRHALLETEEAEGTTFDRVITLQPTSPFRRGADIDAAVDLLDDTPASGSVISVVQMKGDHPVLAKRIEDDLLVDYCVPEPEGTRRQDLPPAFLRNGAIYLTRRAVVMSGSVRGTAARPLLMPPERSLNIDEPLDLVLAEALLHQGLAATDLPPITPSDG